MSTIGNKKRGQPLNSQHAETNDTLNSSVSVEIKVLTINVFFDGTANNWFNTELRLKDDPSEDEKQLQQKLKGQTSYENYYSNVALLYLGVTKITNIIENIYVQGAGTLKYEKDKKFGLGFAQGEAGITKRVSWVFMEIQRILKKSPANKIVLNVFGFSRGASFARYFCAMAKITEEEIQKEDELFASELDAYSTDVNKSAKFSFTPIDSSGRRFLMLKNKDIRINLVGLYDTVSSIGLNHYNDVKYYHLNIGKKQEIARVVHLTAQNDYRHHFPLTHIDTAIKEGMGFECSFPGVHSDIGGAYNASHPDNSGNHPKTEKQYLSTEHETDESVLGEISWKWFQEMGYYQGDPTSLDKTKWGDFDVRGHNGSMIGLPTVRKVYANRAVPYNNYQFIFANVMKKIAEDAASLTFNGKKKDDLDNAIASIAQHDLLKKIDDYVCRYVLNNYKENKRHSVSLGDHIKLSKEEQKQLYHDYLHNSLDAYSVASEGNHFIQSNPPKRRSIHDDTKTHYRTNV